MEGEIRSKPRERLAKAPIQLGGEVANTELAERAVKPVGQCRVVEVLTPQRTNRKRVWRTPDPPESRPRGRDAPQRLRHPPAR